MISSTYLKTKQLYKVSFELPQEQVGTGRDVRVLANFNDWSWDHGLQLRNGQNTYKGNVELPAGHYQFRYLVDGHHWTNDDSAEAYTDSGHGSTNCCLNLEEVLLEPAPAKKKKAAPKKEKAAKPAAKKATKSKGDDLKKIEGIGPKIAGLLNEANIRTFDDLSKASAKKLADVLEKAGARFRLAKPDTWQEQAKLAAAGKMDELKAMQDKLKGGRRK